MRKPIGTDCDGNGLWKGDWVEVIKEEDTREGNPKYSWCSLGKKGKVLDWIGGDVLRIAFGDKDAGCYEKNLRKDTYHKSFSRR